MSNRSYRSLTFLFFFLFISEIFGQVIISPKTNAKQNNSDRLIISQNNIYSIPQGTRTSFEKIPTVFSFVFDYNTPNEITEKIEKESSKKQRRIYSELLPQFITSRNLTIWYSSDL